MRAKEFFIRAGKLLSAVLFLSVGLSMASQAMEPCTLTFPVKINVSGNAPETTYRVKMEADAKNPNAPLPSPSEIARVGSGSNQKHEVQFKITYTAETQKDLIYKIRQTTEAANNLELSQDEYTVIVQVFEDETKSGSLKAVYWVGKKDSETKSGGISFTNRYNRSPNPGGGGDTPPGGTTPGGNTPPGSNTPPSPTQPTPKTPEVQGEVRPFDPVKAIQKVPAVFGAIRKVATGDSSSMALYGLFAATSMCSLFFWGIGQKKKEKKA